MSEVYRLDVFTTEPGQGNPTGVVLFEDDLSDHQMAALARHHAIEMAFALQPATKATLRLRYFSPAGEMNLCGHATVGALWLLYSQGKLNGDCTLETLAGTLRANVKPSGVLVQQPLPTFNKGPFSVEAVAAALNIDPSKIVGPLVAASTGRPKLLIPLPDYAVLDSLRPDFAAVNSLCTAIGVTGLYPFTLATRKQGVTAEARQFPANIGFREDPVTGVAMAALACHLVQVGLVEQSQSKIHLIIEQGYATGRAGRAEVLVKRRAGQITHIQLGGQAVEAAERLESL